MVGGGSVKRRLVLRSVAVASGRVRERAVERGGGFGISEQGAA